MSLRSRFLFSTYRCPLAPAPSLKSLPSIGLFLYFCQLEAPVQMTRSSKRRHHLVFCLGLRAKRSVCLNYFVGALYHIEDFFYPIIFLTVLLWMCWNLSDAFSVSIDIIMWIFFFTFKMEDYTDLSNNTVNQSCILE